MSRVGKLWNLAVEAWKYAKKNGTKDINVTKARAVLEYENIKEDGITIPEAEILSFAEQIVWRTQRCAPCVQNGQCLHCECTMPGAAFVPDNYCSEGRWMEMLPPEEWEAFKSDNWIHIGIMF